MEIFRFARNGTAATLMMITMAGCASTHATYVPDGRRGYSVDCGGFLNSWSTCLIKAGRACGNRGYDTIQGTEDDRSLLVACKVPPIAATGAAAR
jgi:hypothetical protein